VHTHTTARILPQLVAHQCLRGALADLCRLRIVCEAKDFGRPPPLLAALFELLTGRPFDSAAGASLAFATGEADGAAAAGTPLDTVWMRIDTRYGDLASGSGRLIELGRRLDHLAAPVREALATRRALLVLDWSHEGRPTFRTSNIGRIVEPHGIAPRNVVVLTQNTAPPEPARENDLRIVNAHAFIPAYWRLAFGRHVRSGEFGEPFGFAAAAPAERTHHYVCLNFEATATRANVVARLLDRPERGHLSFRKEQFRRNMPGSAAFNAELDRVSPAGERGANHDRVTRFLSSPRSHFVDLSPGESPHGPHRFLPVAALRESALFVVTEKEMAPPDQRRFTEKTLKALIAGLPFVVFGNQGTLALLAEAGFDLLADFVDPAYDGEADPAARFAAAWNALEDALARPPSFTAAEHARLADAAVHNAAIFEGPLFDRWVLAPLREIAAVHPLASAPPPAAAAVSPRHAA